MRFRTGAITTALLLSSGCATQLAVRPGAGSPYSAGIPAVLPFTQYTVTETWRLVSCDPANPNPVSLKVEAVASEAEDDAHRYLIDPTGLQGAATTGEFKADYHDNSTFLRSINAQVEDRSAAVIGNVAKTVASLAPLFFGVPPGVRALGAPVCTSDAQGHDAKAWRERSDTLAAELEVINGQVAAATDALLRTAAVAAQMGSSIDPATRDQYGEAIRRLEGLTHVQTRKKEQLAEALRPLTFQRVSRWPQRSTVTTRDPGTIDAATAARWFGTSTSTGMLPSVHLALTDGADRPPVLGSPSAAAVASGSAAGGAAAREPRLLAGVPYRTPRPGRLWACFAHCASAPETSRRLIVDGPVAQLGNVNILPVQNRAFGSAAVAAEFRRNGSLNSASFAQRAAPLEQATGAIATAAGTLAPVFDPTARLQRETAYLEALQARREAQQALEPVSVSPADASRAQLEEDSALLNAEITNLQARLTLRDLQARLAAQ